MKKTSFALYTARGAIIAALYVALTMLSTALGLSSGVIQFRISEALCILPIFLPEAIPGLFIGCIVANLLSGCFFLDILFGSIATLIGAIGARILRRLPEKFKWVTTLPTLFSNALIVPLVLLYVYGAEGTYPLFMLFVGIGELVCGVICGSALYYFLKRYPKIISVLKNP